MAEPAASQQSGAPRHLKRDAQSHSRYAKETLSLYSRWKKNGHQGEWKDFDDQSPVALSHEEEIQEIYPKRFKCSKEGCIFLAHENRAIFGGYCCFLCSSNPGIHDHDRCCSRLFSSNMIPEDEIRPEPSEVQIHLADTYVNKHEEMDMQIKRRCASPLCPFYRNHSLPGGNGKRWPGTYCCFNCNKSRGSHHGPHCNEEIAATGSGYDQEVIRPSFAFKEKEEKEEKALLVTYDGTGTRMEVFSGPQGEIKIKENDIPSSSQVDATHGSKPPSSDASAPMVMFRTAQSHAMHADFHLVGETEEDLKFVASSFTTAFFDGRLDEANIEWTPEEKEQWKVYRLNKHKRICAMLEGKPPPNLTAPQAPRFPKAAPSLPPISLSSDSNS